MDDLTGANCLVGNDFLVVQLFAQNKKRLLTNDK